MKELISIIKKGGIVVHRTDTLYGLLASAQQISAVERIYHIKKRDRSKPFIILISEISQLDDFGVCLNDAHRTFLKDGWPEKTSIVFPIEKNPSLQYLSRGKESLAFRIPKDDTLFEIIEHTGPLVAPSANPEGFLPAQNIQEARSYFGDAVDYYEDDGKCLNCEASKIIRILEDGNIEYLRN